VHVLWLKFKKWEGETLYLNATIINIIVWVLLVGVLVLNIFIKIRRSIKAPLGRVALILAALNRNEKLVDNFGFHQGADKLKTGAWTKNKDKVDFLPQELRMTLSHAFEMSEEVNDRINTARKFKSDSYMAGIDVSKLKEPIAKSKQQLQEWIQDNMQNPEYQPKRRRSIFR
jgi:hypothetical protein